MHENIFPKAPSDIQVKQPAVHFGMKERKQTPVASGITSSRTGRANSCFGIRRTGSHYAKVLIIRHVIKDKPRKVLLKNPRSRLKRADFRSFMPLHLILFRWDAFIDVFLLALFCHI